MNSYQLAQYPMYPQSTFSDEKPVADTWDTYPLIPQANDGTMAPVLPVGADLGRHVTNMNMNYMDEAFYNQMSFIFTGSSPFGERSDQHGFVNHDMYGILSNAPLAPPPPAQPPPLANPMYVISRSSQNADGDRLGVSGPSCGEHTSHRRGDSLQRSISYL